MISNDANFLKSHLLIAKESKSRDFLSQLIFKSIQQIIEKEDQNLAQNLSFKLAERLIEIWNFIDEFNGNISQFLKLFLKLLNIDLHFKSCIINRNIFLFIRQFADSLFFTAIPVRFLLFTLFFFTLFLFTLFFYFY